MSEYSEYVVQSYSASGAGSKKSIRARPLPGQGIDPAAHVECSSEMRDSQPAGALFAITAKVATRKGGTPFLYTSFKWPYRVLTTEEAQAIIARTASDNGFGT